MTSGTWEEKARTSAGPASGRILIVEDDSDTAQLLKISLEMEGLVCDCAETAAAALQSLTERHFDLVITDYDLPGKTGATLLAEAEQARLLDGTSCVVITAHPDPQGVQGFPLIRKPIDLGRFLQQMRAILQSPGTNASMAPEPSTIVPRVHLVLFVSPESLLSTKARATLEGLLGEYDPREVRYEVCDLTVDTARAEAARVVFTPTLVKQAPEPITWVLGDLSETQIVREFLSLSGVQPRR